MGTLNSGVVYGEMQTAKHRYCIRHHFFDFGRFYDVAFYCNRFSTPLFDLRYNLIAGINSHVGRCNPCTFVGKRKSRGASYPGPRTCD